MPTQWDASASPRRAQDDGPDAMREWHWQCYTDHLEDLGYDLDGGESPDEERAETEDAASRTDR